MIHPLQHFQDCTSDLTTERVGTTLRRAPLTLDPHLRKRSHPLAVVCSQNLALRLFVLSTWFLLYTLIYFLQESPNGATYTSNSIGAPALFTPSGNAPSTGSINYPDRSIRPPELDVSPPFPDNNGQRPSSVRSSLKYSSRSARVDLL